MIDERLVVWPSRSECAWADAEFPFDPFEKIGVVVAGIKMPGIHEPVRSMANAHFIDHGTANGHLDSLKCVYCKQTQFAVESVKVQNIAKLDPFPERFRGISPILIKERVGRQPIVADKLQVMFRLGAILNIQSPRFQFGNLLGNRQGWLFKFHKDILLRKKAPALVR